ncbi:DUF1405 domain-containing protein [Halalkalicoccus jeotgali]|uniref:DUF1405 domain-containing protein n=1 Tax=Halalkalicoccus jeotgali (strain DSM 18796 / CECT 7217 / JCM 14584 / KCTC 4019 / B3) TaxID=795797 RepID=D8JAA4_HALJB|nr:DUF1405 domain-containing protein [Halalkalicoccus jeotgali]ADJ14626.1 hypothetical protein HacjB3_06175 [Halalkalicoccus jeotgali B3]ELY39525.1 hypothetical protein C497_04567 [Halalkalicoccus jeotgali B3]
MTGPTLPAWLAPLPRRLEEFALRYAWLIVAINVVGTAFGFWYYRFQFAGTPAVMWPWVPDSPLATLFIALSLALWKLDRQSELVDMLAFFGNIKLGLWTPFVLVAFREAFLAGTAPPMYAFLLVSHLGMVAQAFLIQRYSDFSISAIAAALVWYSVDLTVDYFVPVLGGPHHTTLPYAEPAAVALAGNTTAFLVAAWGATLLTVWITFLALATRAKKATTRASRSAPR